MRPVKEYEDGLYYINKMNPHIAYMWEPEKLEKAELKYVTQSVLIIRATGYYGFFKPNWDQVLESIPKALIDFKGVEIPDQEFTSCNILSFKNGTYHSVITKFYD